MSVLRDLAERCEAAEGPSFVLEQEIGKALGFPGIAPPFTASVDRAMTLVPEGWIWSVETWPGGAESNVRQPYDDGEEVQAKTPALALCAAALKSRAA